MTQPNAKEEIIEKAAERADYFRPDARVVPVASVRLLLETHATHRVEEERQRILKWLTDSENPHSQIRNGDVFTGYEQALNDVGHYLQALHNQDKE